jgi:hypothetical protein
MKPADAGDVAANLEALAGFYPMKALDAGDMAIWRRSWKEDLGDVPADILAEACRLWRTSEERWFPTPGQLLALIEPILEARRSMVALAAEALTWPIETVEWDGYVYRVPPGGNPHLIGQQERPGIRRQLSIMDRWPSRRIEDWGEHAWGPPPGHPDCLIWPSVLERFLGVSDTAARPAKVRTNNQAEL